MYSKVNLMIHLETVLTRIVELAIAGLFSKRKTIFSL